MPYNPANGTFSDPAEAIAAVLHTNSNPAAAVAAASGLFVSTGAGDNPNGGNLRGNEPASVTPTGTANDGNLPGS